MNQNFSRPYIISWNLTYRCNLECEHCYLDAGPNTLSSRFNRESVPFEKGNSLRDELSTAECFKIIDQIADFAPEALTILTGGEPLLRRDILEIAKYASDKKLWVVVGTNGVKISENLVLRLKESGVRGMALSLDSLNPEIHDKFRGVKGAWQNTVNGAKILTVQGLSYIIQTTVGKHNWEQVEKLADFAFELGAKVWNLYFLVSTGRGKYVSDITPEQYDQILLRLLPLQKKFFQRMMINAKCAPHFARVLFEKEPDSPFLKSFSGGAGGCPAGTHYMGIRPNGDMTPCPYLPVFGGNLRKKSFKDIWNDSEVFVKIRKRSANTHSASHSSLLQKGNGGGLGGRCGDCEFSGVCGGCRARAFGVSGDYMQEDPWCTYQPGKFGKEKISFESKILYGMPAEKKLEWDESAVRRLANVPLFVRGMVIKAVESYCQSKGISTVSARQLEELRSKIPMPKLFAQK